MVAQEVPLYYSCNRNGQLFVWKLFLFQNISSAIIFRVAKLRALVISLAASFSLLSRLFAAKENSPGTRVHCYTPWHGAFNILVFYCKLMVHDGREISVKTFARIPSNVPNLLKLLKQLDYGNLMPEIKVKKNWGHHTRSGDSCVVDHA